MMTSPFTGGKVTLVSEQMELRYRAEMVQFEYQSYQCEDTKAKFTTTELDTKNMERMYDVYRKRHHIPTPEQIKATCQKYAVSPTKMAAILGLGTNQVRKYINGEMPSISNAKLLSDIENEEQFLIQVHASKVELSKKSWSILSAKKPAKVVESANYVFTIDFAWPLEFMDVEAYKIAA